MLQKLDSVGGLLLTHAAVAVSTWLVARGWVTLEQVTPFVEQVKTHWIPAVIGAGSVGGAIAANRKATRKR